MIETLISSKTRIKLLLKFFLNGNNKGYLRGLEAEFGESSNAIRIELNRLEDAGLLTSSLQGNKKIFTADQQHPLYEDIHNILVKYTGLDKIVERVAQSLGQLEEVYVVGDLAKGLATEVIELVFAGDVDVLRLKELVDKVEKKIHKKVMYTCVGQYGFSASIYPDHLLLWSK